MTVVVRQARDEGEVEAALALRHEVFCGEQGVAPEAERDGRDDEAIQIVAVDSGEVVGTCRLLVGSERAQLGRMAVARSRRGAGVGAELLEAAERAAVRAGAARVTLHAQTAALRLYARAGYEVRGDVFLEEGIEHVTMEHLLA